MPFVFACSTCGRQLTAREEYAGRQVKCPACQEVLAVPPPPGGSQVTAVPPLPPHLPFDMPRLPTATPLPPAGGGDPFAFDTPGPAAPKPADFDWGEAAEEARAEADGPLEPGWRYVSTGVLLIQLSMYSVLLAIPFFLFAIVMAVLLRGADIPMLPEWLGELLFITAYVLALIGHIFVCFVPSNSEDARFYAILAAVCSGLCCLFVPWLVGLILLNLSIQRMCRRFRFAVVADATNTYTILFPILTVVLGALPAPIFLFMAAVHLGSFRDQLNRQIRRRGIRRFRQFDDEPRPRRRRRDDNMDVFDD